MRWEKNILNPLLSLFWMLSYTLFVLPPFPDLIYLFTLLNLMVFFFLNLQEGFAPPEEIEAENNNHDAEEF